MKGIIFALLNAVLYALCMPFSQFLLADIPPLMMSSFLYLGVVTGMSLVLLARRAYGVRSTEKPLGRSDLPYIASVIPCGIAATVLLMAGIQHSSAANASLLNNFEIVSTSIIALCLFHEHISKRLWAAIVLVTAASLILSFKGTGSLEFSTGSILVVASCVCWGFENNFTRRLSGKDPLETVIVKSCGAGAFALAAALISGETMPPFRYCAAALLLGFVSYGVSNFCYINAQRTLGAAKAATFYAVSPFIGTALSLAIFHQMPSKNFFIALPVMAAGAVLAARDSLKS